MRLVLPILLFTFAVAPVAALRAADKPATGAAIYKQLCVKCHGVQGQGVPDVNEEPLTGTKSIEELAKVVAETMPEEKPELCTGDDAKRVAKYIYDAFYSPAARSGSQTARIELARLTVPQYLNSAADLVSDSNTATAPGGERGLRGDYYSTRRFRRDDKAFDRVDPQIAFDFGSKSPDGEKIKDEKEFSIRWAGSVIAEETGEYEFTIRTDVGARLWVNDNRNMLIDAWVASKGKPKEHTATLRLLGGRAYPIRLDAFKYKQDVASIELLWKPPHKSKQVVPPRNLSPRGLPATFIVSAAFPPDDRVSGYERGTSISKEWHQAATAAALEIAGEMAEKAEQSAGRRGRGRRGRRGRGGRGDRGSRDPNERARELCRRFAERAFRRPLTDEQRRFFVDRHFESAEGAESAENVTTAVKRSVLLVLKSPRFLYPGLSGETFDDYDAAAKLALALWDSLPDDELLRAASRGELQSAEQIERQARRMLGDPRAKVKMRGTLHEWLQMDEKEGLNKDERLFPDFNADVASDMRTSLDLFLDDVVWSESSDYRQLLLADYVYLNDRLAAFYGVKASPEAGRFEKATLDAGKRAGVLTHPFVMSNLAYHNLSSPIHRGVFVTRRLIGRSLKPPPQATEFKDGDFDPHMTTREKVALATKGTACLSCHRVINPLGFSLEHFDAVGRYREKERDRPIDAAAEFDPLSGKPVRFRGARDLAEFVAASETGHGAFVDHLFHHTVKQPINAYGDSTRDDLVRKFRESGFHVRNLVVEIVKSSIMYERRRSAASKQ